MQKQRNQAYHPWPSPKVMEGKPPRQISKQKRNSIIEMQWELFRNGRLAAQDPEQDQHSHQRNGGSLAQAFPVNRLWSLWCDPQSSPKSRSPSRGTPRFSGTPSSEPFLPSWSGRDGRLHCLFLMPGLENFDHYSASMWDECNCAVVWSFFGIAFLWDWNENWPFPVLWPLLSFQNLLVYWVQPINSIIF